LDLVDFRDRVRPLAHDMSLLDRTAEHQRESVDKLVDNYNESKKILNEFKKKELKE